MADADPNGSNRGDLVRWVAAEDGNIQVKKFDHEPSRD
jgi:hypothetical protein